MKFTIADSDPQAPRAPEQPPPMPRPPQISEAKRLPRTRAAMEDRPFPHLYAERIRHGLTQGQMARVLGLTRSAYSMKELGHRQFAPYEMAVIAGLLNGSMDTLFITRDLYPEWLRGSRAADEYERMKASQTDAGEEALKWHSEAMLGRMQAAQAQAEEMGKRYGKSAWNRMRRP